MDLKLLLNKRIIRGTIRAPFRLRSSMDRVDSILHYEAVIVGNCTRTRMQENLSPWQGPQQPSPIANPSLHSGFPTETKPETGGNDADTNGEKQCPHDRRRFWLGSVGTGAGVCCGSFAVGIVVVPDDWLRIVAGWLLCSILWGAR